MATATVHLPAREAARAAHALLEEHENKLHAGRAAIQAEQARLEKLIASKQATAKTRREAMAKELSQAATAGKAMVDDVRTDLGGKVRSAQEQNRAVSNLHDELLAKLARAKDTLA